jgi:predicted anti-sigma-YlaC factor YlaD
MPDLDCIDLVELTTEYFEGKLSAVETARLEAHLTECDGCTEFVRQMRVTQDVLGHVDTMAMPAAGRERLLGAFRAWKSEETTTRRQDV